MSATNSVRCEFCVCRQDGKCLTLLVGGIKSEKEARAIAAQFAGDVRIGRCTFFC